MDNHLILGINRILQAKKNSSYRENVYISFKTLVSFLQDKGLTIKKILVDDEQPPDDFELRRFDLTEDGFTFLKSVLSKWLNAVGSGRISVTDTSMFERELKKLRK